MSTAHAMLGDQPFAGGGWQEDAACRNTDVDVFFSVDEQDQRVALTHCRQCPVQRECLQYALENREMYGVWGGMTEGDRRAVIRDIRRHERSDAA